MSHLAVDEVAFTTAWDTVPFVTKSVTDDCTEGGSMSEIGRFAKDVYRQVAENSQRSSNLSREVINGTRDFGRTRQRPRTVPLRAVVSISPRHLEGINRHFVTVIEHLLIPKSWSAEGITKPSQLCARATVDVLAAIFSEFQMLPFKISASREGGISAAFRGSSGQHQLVVEVDEDLDVCAVVSDKNVVLASGFLDQSDDRRRLFAMVNR